MRFIRLLLALVWVLPHCLGSLNLEYDLDKSELESGTSLRVLKFGDLHGDPIKLGSKVQIQLKSFSPLLESDITGVTVQSVEVGKHSIIPLNDALLNMRLGEIRRLGISIGSYGKIYYEISLLRVL